MILYDNMTLYITNSMTTTMKIMSFNMIEITIYYCKIYFKIRISIDTTAIV